MPFSLVLDLERGNRPQQLRCPFAENHERGDIRKSARYYPSSNRVFCFTENKSWRPTDYVAQKRRITQLEAAKWILDKFSGKEERARLSRTVDLQVPRSPSRDCVLALADILPPGSLMREYAELVAEKEFDERYLTYYIEIERELEALKREVADARSCEKDA